MHPVIFKFGPLEIKTYGLMLAASFVAGYLLAAHRAEKRGLDKAILIDLAFYILLSAVIGSRIFYVATHWGEYSSRPLSVFYLWEGGLSMMGGVLLALGVSWLYLKAKEVDFYGMADLVAPSIALGLFLTRIGCFMYGCCYGTPTSLGWGVVFPSNSAAGSHFHEPIHPAQLYASGYGLLIFGILMLLDRTKRGAGFLFGSFLVLYSIARFLVDFVRYYEPDQYVRFSGLALTNNQVILVFLFLFGVYLVVRGRKAQPS